MRTLFTFILIVLSFLTSSAQTILSQWNFNSNPPDASTATGSTLPSVGSGTFTNIGGVTVSFASGAGSTDAAATDNTGLQTTGYPTASANNKTAGVEVAVNTTGFGGIYLRFDLRISNTAADTYTIQYSTDGTTFTDFTTLVPPVNGASPAFNNNITYNLSAITALDNNPNVKFRVVSTFSGAGSSYLGNNGTYSTAGTVRFDMITVLRLSVAPITLKSFSATENNSTINLKWLTANESNIKNYVVEKSENGINFLPITTINAKNNTENNYQYIDVAATKNTLYYRLKIEDNNGKIIYSSIARVDNIDATSKLFIYPTVATTSINAKLKADKNALATIQIIDAIGKIATQKNWNISSGINTMPIDITNLSKGVYRLRLVGENINEISSFIKN